MREHTQDQARARAAADRPASPLRPLSALPDLEIADGDPDIRAWRVFDVNGDAIGSVHDLVIDVPARMARYLDIVLDEEMAGPVERHVLVPIGTARVSDDVDAVTLATLDAGRIARLPAYEHGPVTRDQERALHEALTDSAAPLPDADTDFYAQAQFDTAAFWGARRKSDRMT